MPDYLRVARRGAEVYFIAGVIADKKEFLLGSAEASTSPIVPRGVRVVLHTGGAGRTSRLLVKSVDVRAESGTVIDLAPEQTPQPSLPSRLLNSLRGLFP